MTDNRKYRKNVVLICFIIQLSLGPAGVWGVFQSYLIISKETPNALFAWPATFGTLTYSLMMLFLTIGSIVGGKLMKRVGSPKSVIIIGGIVYGTGFILAALTSVNTPWLLWIAYGIMGGTGMGIAYSTTISICQNWYPDQRGMVTGIILSALGLGGLLFTPVTELLITEYSVQATFICYGLLFIVVTGICSQFLRNPPVDYALSDLRYSAKKAGLNIIQISPAEVLRKPQFYRMTVTLMLATAAGSMMFPMVKIVGLQSDSGLTRQAAIAGVMIISITNTLGRLFWGPLSDKIGRKITILIMMVLSGFSIASLSVVKGMIMLAVFALIGFCYGGFHSVFPALASDLWGEKNVATNYGMSMIGFGFGAVLSSNAIAYISNHSSFNQAYVIAGLCAVTGFAILLTLKVPKRA